MIGASGGLRADTLERLSWALEETGGTGGGGGPDVCKEFRLGRGGELREVPPAPGGEPPSFESFGGEDPDLSRPNGFRSGDPSGLACDDPDGDESGNGAIVGSRLLKDDVEDVMV